jgi:hypothetical protein
MPLSSESVAKKKARLLAQKEAAATVNSVYCNSCGGTRGPIVNKAMGYCERCNLCGNCGRFQVDDETRICKWCRCQDCGALPHRNAMYPDGVHKEIDVYFYRCKGCMFKKYPDRSCVVCKKELSEYFVRFDKRLNRPSVCASCRANFKKAKCWFCESPLQTTREKGRHTGLYKAWMVDGKGHSVFVCVTCFNTTSCGNGKCTPVSPCEHCVNPPDPHSANHTHAQDIIYGGGFYFKQDPVFHPVQSVSDRKQNRSTRMLGVEIEVAGLRTNTEISHQVNPPGGRCICPLCGVTARASLRQYVMGIGGSIVADESLPAGGVEITMPPAGGDIFMHHIETVSNLIYAAGGYVNEKCGTHIHVDARDYTTQDMRKLLMLWVKTEPAFLFTQDAKRIYKTKSHCFPTARKYKRLLSEKLLAKSAEEWSEMARDSLNDAIYAKDWPRPPRLMRGNNRTVASRYDDLNIHSWFFRGTVECRLHAGTIDAKKIQNWGMLLASFLDAAVRMSEREILELPDKEPKAVLLTVVPSRVHPYLMNRWDIFEAGHKGKENYFKG